MSDMDEFIGEFIVESHENLDRLDEALVALESEPNDSDRIASIFRTIHTIKGSCGFLGFQKLEKVTHSGENLLSRIRDGELAMNAPIADALLAMADIVRSILKEIEQAGSEGERDCSELIGRLDELRETGGVGPAAGGAASSPVAPKEPAPSQRAAEEHNAAAAPQEVGPAAVAQEHESDVVLAGDPGESARTAGGRKQRAGTSAIRVEVGVLDQLMNLVGELVLSRNQLLQTVGCGDLSGISVATQRLDLITMELQEGVMKTRMQPVGNVWSKFPRVVRDLAHALGKKIRLVMEGTETELDKTLLEAIGDPLTHLVRNSVDHGIEGPEARLAAGKNAEGTLLLRAFHEGGQVIIEIVDDGKGLDTERIRAKAIERGLLTAERAQRMGDKEAANLIFLPGFSTAEKITNVSGRGVGMDVVRTNIEKIGGSVDLQSTLGHGTTVRVRIPLTLAIVPALIVASDGDRFAIPQASLLELVRLDAKRAKREIESVHGAPVYRLRGRLLPLVDLRNVLEQPTRGADVEGATNIVVLQCDGRLFGLVVDEVQDSSEIVVKPLGAQLESIEVFAGATVMGDGSVALILDVAGTAERAGLRGELQDRGDRLGSAESDQAGSDADSYLIFAVSPDVQMALKLDAVARLEKIPREQIEHRGAIDVVQYRGEIMPLVHLSVLFGNGARGESDASLPTIVHSHEGRSIGFVLRNVVDIINDAIEIDTAGARPGILGSSVLAGRVTEILDVDAIVRTAGVLALRENRMHALSA
ncbi:MAG: chemotaxis protein CheW [Planctomycetota bacterium]